MPQAVLHIRRRLMQMVLITCGIALLLTAGSLLGTEFLTFRQSAVRQLETLSQAIAANSSASLAFDNADDARAVLSAFKAEPHIGAAALYDNSGALFASYPESRSASDFPATPGLSGYRFEQDRLVGVEAVMQGSRRMGTLFVSSDLDAIYQRMLLYSLITSIVMVLSALVAYVVSRQLQHQISAPILALADLAGAISDRHDYSVRAQPSGSYELDRLTNAFNHMLTQIEQSEHRLHAQVGRLNLLQEITRAIGDRQDLGSIFQVVLGSIEANLPVDFGLVCLYHAASERLVVNTVGPASHELATMTELVEQTQLTVDQNGLSRCLTGVLVYEPDVRPLPFDLPSRLTRAGLHSVVIAPLLVENQVFGVLIAARHLEHGFSSQECEFIKQLTEHVALASHQTQLYGALQQAYDDLRQTQHTVMQQERLRALGQMASGIAHDINNAISPVSLYTDTLLEREPNLSDRARSYLTTIQRAIEDVASTVARMREFYRQREPELTLSRINLNQLIEQVLELTNPRWTALPQQRGISVELKTELATSLPDIMGAEGEIRDALTNLIFNAVDAMPQGGTLTLRTRSAVDDEDASRVSIEVSDSGIGMDEETRRRCLEPFFTTKGERGTGLGLAMVYGMVQRHSAELDIESTVGVGTTMRVVFSAHTELASPTVYATATLAPTKRLRILLVDDDPLLLKSLQDALESDGHLVTATNGGQAGIDAFNVALRAGTAFGIVVTDLGMPHVDGRRVAAGIKAASAKTPVIMLTGWGQRMQAENDIPPHVDRLLNKPPRLQQLRNALAELTG